MIFNKPYFKPLNLVLYICLTGILFLQNNYRTKVINRSENINHFQEEQRLNSQLNFQKIVPSFGFDNLKADELFLNFIQYYGDRSAREETGYSLTPKYFATLINYDIQFIEAYLILANANTMYAGHPKQTISLIEQILDNQSTQNNAQLYYLLWLHKAYDELLFLGDIKAATLSYHQAQEWLQQNQQPESSSKLNQVYFPNTQLISDNSHLIQTQILAWSTVLPHVKNSETRQKIIEKINHLKIELAQI